MIRAASFKEDLVAEVSHLPAFAILLSSSVSLPNPRLAHGVVTLPRRLSPWIEPWFLAYACLGVVQGGMLPLLLPLSAGGSTHAGVIVGAMNLAGLTAPILGLTSPKGGGCTGRCCSQECWPRWWRCC